MFTNANATHAQTFDCGAKRDKKRKKAKVAWEEATVQPSNMTIVNQGTLE